MRKTIVKLAFIQLLLMISAGSYAEDCSGAVSSVDFSFFSEIFLTTDGDLEDAFLTFPSEERVAFEDRRRLEGAERDNLFLVAGNRRFQSREELEAAYPDGDYRIEFITPSGGVEQGDLEFPGGGLPEPPRIVVNGQPGGNCTGLDPNRDLNVTWSPFARGRADPRGILDDLIFVILTDAAGNRVAHSGRPFEERPYLTYADDHFTIGAETLRPEEKYTLSVEHAVLADTRTYAAVPAMTTYAVTTRLSFETAAEPEETPVRPSIESQTVMLYYADLEAPAAFYGEILGLQNTLDLNWVKIFQTSATGTVGLVLEGEGYHPVRAENSVMLSLVTREIDAWYQRLKSEPRVVFLKEIRDDALVRSFLIEDPGGYTVEFYQWQQPPK